MIKNQCSYRVDLLARIKTDILNLSCKLYCFKVVYEIDAFLWKSYKEISRLFHCSVIKDRLFFDAFETLVSFAPARLYYQSLKCLSTTFSTFLSDSRRRRDLNPRAAINDLHPFQGCPFSHLGYFSRCLTNSELNRLMKTYVVRKCLTANASKNIHQKYALGKHLFYIFLKLDNSVLILVFTVRNTTI